MISIIVAIANNNVIGKNNKLIWHIPEDLKRFKRITDGKTMVMGAMTFESLGKVLPNRKHIVLCKGVDLDVDNENVILLKELEDLNKHVQETEEVFIIGGGTVYKLFLPYADKLYITWINQDFDGDAFFPEIDEQEWEVIEREPGIKNEENPYDYEYVTYIRKANENRQIKWR